MGYYFLYTISFYPSSQVAFISEFTLKCANGAENVPLFAEVEGRLTPVARTGPSRYQVNWTEDLKKASSGDHIINLYSEDGFAAYRKAQRSGEATSSVKPFSNLKVYHSGTYSGPLFKSELVATVLIAAAAYLAFSEKSKFNPR